MKTLTISKGEPLFTVTFNSGRSFHVTCNKGQFWESGDSEYDEPDSKTDTINAGYDPAKKVLDFGIFRYFITPDGQRIGGLKLTQDQIDWFVSIIANWQRDQDDNQKDREDNRPSPCVDRDLWVLYSIGCDTGLTHSTSNVKAINLAIAQGAAIAPVLRGERDQTNKYPGQMDGHIDCCYAEKVDGTWQATGYKYIYEDLYCILREDYNAALALIEQAEQDEKRQQQEPFDMAKKTGLKVLIGKSVAHESETPLAGNGEGDLVDVLTYAMPDGTTAIDYYRNY